MDKQDFSEDGGDSFQRKQRMSGTFDGLQVVHGQLQTLAPPEHAHCVPLIIVQILTRKNSLWTFACRTVQRPVNTQADEENTYMTDS